ncbi:MAG: energy transducer TonB, partial [Telluria sp.]
AILASAAAAPPAAPRTITSGVEYIHAPQPVYPQLSRRMGEQGKVILRILVNEKGLPDQVLVQTSSGSARLDEAGRQAALRALFKPYLEDGRAVAVFVIVPLNFQLAS